MLGSMSSARVEQQKKEESSTCKRSTLQFGWDEKQFEEQIQKRVLLPPPSPLPDIKKANTGKAKNKFAMTLWRQHVSLRKWQNEKNNLQFGQCSKISPYSFSSPSISPHSLVAMLLVQCTCPCFWNVYCWIGFYVLFFSLQAHSSKRYRISKNQRLPAW